MLLKIIGVIIFVEINQFPFVITQRQPKHVIYPSQYFPTNCQMKYTGVPGICKLFDSCLPAQYEWYFQRIQPTTCYFEKFQPIICCPTATNAMPSMSGPMPLTAINSGPEQMSLTTINSGPELMPLTAINRENNKIQRISNKICDDYYVKPKQNEGDFFITVVGGDLAEKGEFPYMAAIGWDNIFNETEFNCGGVLISPNYILTAAHCANLGGASPDIVRVGDDGLNTTTDDYDYGLETNPSEDIKIETIFVHPNYNIKETYNDIAIIKLISNSSIKPACLWQTNNIIDQYSKGEAIGYGHTQFAGARSNFLMKVTLDLIDNLECSKSYPPEEKFPRGIINTQMCAGDSTGVKDTCQGDSGGPIVIKNPNNISYAIGITSFGSGCASGIPSVYTRISSYLDWIESIVWP